MESNAVDYPKENYTFDELPMDVLLIVFRYLDLRSLSVLSITSKRLHAAVNDEFLKYKSYKLLVTNQLSVGVRERSLRLLSSINKFFTHYQWRLKRYDERIYLRTREKFRPYISLKEKGVFVGQGREISFYSRNDDGISTVSSTVFRGHTDDISRFVVHGETMISSGNDGKLCCWDVRTGALNFSLKNDVEWNECLYVDWSNCNVAAGFHLAGLVKFFTLDESEFAFQSEIKLNERVWSVAMNLDGSACAIGSAGYQSSPLKIYDLQKEIYTLSVPENYTTGAGVFHTIWENPYTLISGSYDTYIRMWDLRTGSCVQSWSDPYDSAIYSLATDNHCTILAGTANHGRVTLWDKRLSCCMQMYFMSPSTDCGPVYSLDFDPSYMFVALESSLHVLNFSKRSKSLIRRKK